MKIIEITRHIKVRVSTVHLPNLSVAVLLMCEWFWMRKINVSGQSCWWNAEVCIFRLLSFFSLCLNVTFLGSAFSFPIIYWVLFAFVQNGRIESFFSQIFALLHSHLKVGFRTQNCLLSVEDGQRIWSMNDNQGERITPPFSIWFFFMMDFESKLFLVSLFNLH